MSLTQTEKTDEDVQLPTKTIDTDASASERMTTNAVNNVLPARYFKKDEDGNVIEMVEEMFDRVASNVAAAESSENDVAYWTDEFRRQLSTLRFMPNSPTLMNAGLELQQLSACFVLEPQDDMEDILQTVKDAGCVFKSGGGVGYPFSHLRPKGALISSTKGKTSGPISFMRLFDEVCNQVKQGGKRRGAQMAILRVDHPDIGRFVTAKRTEGELSNFNISVAVTDEFKEAVERNDLYRLNDPQSDFETYFTAIEDIWNFYHPDSEEFGESIWQYADDIICTNGETLRERWEDVNWNDLLDGKMQLPARFIWDIIVDGAWRNGEPGLFYIDETNRQHSFDVDEYPKHEIHATNPCAEQPLVDNEACNLGHVNLSLFKKEGTPTFDNFEGDIDDYFNTVLDIADLNRTVRTGVRFLDNVAEMSDFPLDEIEETVDSLRKIGLGVMGWAQLLYQCDIRYGSEASIKFGKKIMNYIDRVATQSSHQLAHERGSFDAWDESKYADPTSYPEWFRDHVHEDPEEYADGYVIRNHNVTTVAPTGTTSMLADTSGGIEPVYNVVYEKQVADDIGTQVEIDSYFRETLEANGIDVDAVKDEAARLMGTDTCTYNGPADLPIPEKLAEKFVVTGDVAPDEHTLMQRVFQDGVDSGISKTINLPTEATRTDVADAYHLSLAEDEFGGVIKGMTVYRNQSRRDQVNTTQSDSDLEIAEAKETLEDNGYQVIEADE